MYGCMHQNTQTKLNAKQACCVVGRWFAETLGGQSSMQSSIFVYNGLCSGSKIQHMEAMANTDVGKITEMQISKIT